MTEEAPSADELIDRGADIDLVATLSSLLEVRADLKKQEDVLKEKKGEISATIKTTMARLGETRFREYDIGSLTISETTRTTIDKTKLKQGMLSVGLSAEKINTVMASCSTTKTSESLTFRAAKGD